jgi:hypothetical protein
MGGGAMGLQLRGFCFSWLFCASVRETAGRGRKKKRRKEKKRKEEKKKIWKIFQTWKFLKNKR